MNVIARLEFELDCLETAVQHFVYDVTGTVCVFQGVYTRTDLYIYMCVCEREKEGGRERERARVFVSITFSR